MQTADRTPGISPVTETYRKHEQELARTPLYIRLKGTPNHPGVQADFVIFSWEGSVYQADNPDDPLDLVRFTLVDEHGVLKIFNPLTPANVGPRVYVYDNSGQVQIDTVPKLHSEGHYLNITGREIKVTPALYKKSIPQLTFEVQTPGRLDTIEMPFALRYYPARAIRELYAAGLTEEQWESVLTDTFGFRMNSSSYNRATVDDSSRTP